MTEIEKLAYKAKEASRELSVLSAEIKNRALHEMADALITNKEEIKIINKIDLDKAKKNAITGAMFKRLELTDIKIEQMADGVRQIAQLADPIGETIYGYLRPNGLDVKKVTIPLGVIGIVYESRPNVTADVAALCLKSGNAVVLRGGSEAINSNMKIAEIINKAFCASGIPENTVNIVKTTDREAVMELLKQKAYIDCIIPRGRKTLIKTCIENSTIPVIEHGDGNCHVYIDKDADMNIAYDIVMNAKIQNPSVCNACETLLVHKDVAFEFIPKISTMLKESNCEIRGCTKTLALTNNAIPAQESDWETEYNDLILAIKIVDDLEEAISHIKEYGNTHSEAIISNSFTAIERFKSAIDSSAVFINCSTRFNDGYELGMGAEMGISTQKLHARGPMGLKEMTTYKYIVSGNGQCRK